MGEEDAATEVFTNSKWLEPVDRIDDLPMEGISDGMRCFVREDGQVYLYWDGEWDEWGPPPKK